MEWYTDRHPGTIIAISPTNAKLTVRQDKATRTDENGMSDQQSYTYSEDPDGEIRTFWRQGNGEYKCGGVRLHIGVRREYLDYSF